MYINLLLGAVALVVLWLYLRKMLVKEDTLREAPADMLEKEVARRRAREAATARAFERLRDIGKERMRPVVRAVAEMRSAMPRTAGIGHGKARRELNWDDEGDTLHLHIRESESAEDVASLSVSWRVPDLDLREAALPGGEPAGVYILRRSGAGGEERAENLENCVRAITSFIVDHMA